VRAEPGSNIVRENFAHLFGAIRVRRDREANVTALAATESITARVLRRLAQSVGTHRFSMWFRQSAQLQYRAEQQLLEITVPNQFVADWIRRNFNDSLRQVLTEEIGPQADLAIRGEAGCFPTPVAPTSVPVPKGRPVPGVRLRHHLEDFIVGSSNELAFAAATRLAATDEPVHGPLFIHGGVGLGKTHLLQGICARLLERRPDARVLYTTSEQFTNDFLLAIRSNGLDGFRRRVRQLDLLAIDDVHFIANKQATQQEFLHTFDAMELAGARVVLASDSHPKLIAQFSQSLVSRCMRGLVVEIHSPDTETRLRIVRALAKRRGLPLMETVVATLAARCEGSVRELEGTLTKLGALASLSSENVSCAATGARQPIGQILVQRLFQAEKEQCPQHATRFASIVQTVAQRLAIEPRLICEGGRQRPSVIARALVVYLARQLTRMSYPEIARALNLASHSTVIAAERRLQQQLGRGERITLAPRLQPIQLPDLLQSLRQDLAA